MLIQVENSQKHYNIDNKIQTLIGKAVELALKEECFRDDIELNIYFVDDEEIKEINREQRNIDKATDVLSFPMVEIVKGKIINLDWDENPENGFLILGDIIISTQRALEQAQEYGHSVEREIMFLVTHGVFHVLGYDHMTDSDEKEMMEKQEKVLSLMGISRG